MTVAFILFFIVFGVIMFRVMSGFWTASRFSNKIFQVVEQELDRQLKGTADAKVSCAHCGSKIAATDKCPNCGAQVAS